MSKSKTMSRRRRKNSVFLSGMAQGNPERFRFEWGKRIVSWLYEINRRGANLCSSESVGDASVRVFEVLEQAETLLTLCGYPAERLVGEETRSVLANECCKVLARVYGAELYRVVNPRYPKPRNGVRGLATQLKNILSNY